MGWSCKLLAKGKLLAKNLSSTRSRTAGNPQKLASAISAAEEQGVSEPLLAKARLQLRHKTRKHVGRDKHAAKDKPSPFVALAAAKRPASPRTAFVSASAVQPTLQPAALDSGKVAHQPSPMAEPKQETHSQHSQTEEPTPPPPALRRGSRKRTAAATDRPPPPPQQQPPQQQNKAGKERASPWSSQSPMSPLQPLPVFPSSASASGDHAYSGTSSDPSPAASPRATPSHAAAAAAAVAAARPGQRAGSSSSSARTSRSSAAGSRRSSSNDAEVLARFSGLRTQAPAWQAANLPAPRRREQQQQQRRLAAASAPAGPATPPAAEALGPWGESSEMTAMIAAEQAALRSGSFTAADLEGLRRASAAAAVAAGSGAAAAAAAKGEHPSWDTPAASPPQHRQLPPQASGPLTPGHCAFAAAARFPALPAAPAPLDTCASAPAELPTSPRLGTDDMIVNTPPPRRAPPRGGGLGGPSLFSGSAGSGSSAFGASFSDSAPCGLGLAAAMDAGMLPLPEGARLWQNHSSRGGSGGAGGFAQVAQQWERVRAPPSSRLSPNAKEFRPPAAVPNWRNWCGPLDMLLHVASSVLLRPTMAAFDALRSFPQTAVCGQRPGTYRSGGCKCTEVLPWLPKACSACWKQQPRC